MFLYGRMSFATQSRAITHCASQFLHTLTLHVTSFMSALQRLYPVLVHPQQGVKYRDQRVRMTYVCQYSCPVTYLKNDMCTLHIIFRTFYLWPWLSPPLMRMQYVNNDDQAIGYGGGLSGRPTKCRYCRCLATKGHCHGNHFFAFRQTIASVA